MMICCFPAEILEEAGSKLDNCVLVSCQVNFMTTLVYLQFNSV